jgi:hypothetical protein
MIGGNVGRSAVVALRAGELSPPPAHYRVVRVADVLDPHRAQAGRGDGGWVRASPESLSTTRQRSRRGPAGRAASTPPNFAQAPYRWEGAGQFFTDLNRSSIWCRSDGWFLAFWDWFGIGGLVVAEDEIEQAGKGSVELCPAQPVEPSPALVALFYQAAGAQDGKMVAPGGLADGQVEGPAYPCPSRVRGQVGNDHPPDRVC